MVGFYIGSQSSERFSPGVRLTGVPIWPVLVFIFNNLLFLVTGLQLRSVLERTSDFPASALFYYGALISAVVIGARLIRVYTSSYLPRVLSAGLRKRDPIAPFRQIFIVAWTGMRGSISLAAAFGIPAVTEFGTPFPMRALIIFITFCVILSTLVFQGSPCRR